MKNYKIITTSNVISEMMKLRGHSVLKEDVEKNIRECLRNSKSSISVKDFRIVFVQPDSYKTMRANSEKDIFVCMGDINKKLPNHLPAEQIFHIDYFLFNISQHKLVPTHELLIHGSEKDKKMRFLRSLNIHEHTQLPLLLTTDPVAKFYGMKKGDICKITRPNYVSYRAVV